MSRPPEGDGFHFEAQLLVVAFERVRAVLEMLPRRRFVGPSPVAAPVAFERLGGERGWPTEGMYVVKGPCPRRSSSSSAPQINQPTLSGSNLIITGSGGTPNASYVMLTSTNVALPKTNWLPVVGLEAAQERKEKMGAPGARPSEIG